MEIMRRTSVVHTSIKLRARWCCAQAATLHRRPGAALLLLVLGALPASLYGQSSGAAREPVTTIDTVAMRADTRVLAADSLGGRGTGSAGAQAAARYIAERLRGLGLRPVGDDFLHAVPLRAARATAATRLVLRHGTDSAAFRHGNDFVQGNGGARAFRDFAGPAIFAGTAGNAGHSLRATDLGGRVIVLAGMPGDSADRLMRGWTAAGAAGVIILTGSEADYEALTDRLGPHRLFVDAAVDEPVWQPDLPVLIAGPRLAGALIAGARLPDRAFRGEPFDAIPLDRTVDALVRVNVTEVAGDNVVAWVPGSDPALRNELVLYTAHYDHLGIGSPDEAGDSIYNGFSDNAAGVAMLLAIADVVRREPPPRSVAFLFLTGEERGLLGASYAAARPPWPLERIRALINLDAGAPPVAPVSWRIAGALGTSLGERADSLARANGWTLQLSAARPNSDYWPFNRRGVPTAFIIPGNEWENTSTSERDALRERWDRYHHRDDEWHADFPFAGLARYASFALQLGLRSAGVR